MTPVAIKKIRKDKGITQAELAEKIGISRGVLVAVEKGERDLSLTEAEKLSQILGIRVEELSGEMVPQYEKYLEMIRAFLQTTNGDGKVPKTKLAKMLYLADFSWYYNTLESMSGMQYRKIDYGPVPDAYFRAIDELETKGVIEVDRKSPHGKDMFLISLSDTGKKLPFNQLAADEKKRIQDIEKKWQDKRTAEIVTFTHNQLPYALPFDDELISYALITQEDPDNIY